MRKKYHGLKVHYIVTNIHSLVYLRRCGTLQGAYFHHTQQTPPWLKLMHLHCLYQQSYSIRKEYIHLELNHPKNLHAPCININQCSCNHHTHYINISQCLCIKLLQGKLILASSKPHKTPPLEISSSTLTTQIQCSQTPQSTSRNNPNPWATSNKQLQHICKRVEHFFHAHVANRDSHKSYFHHASLIKPHKHQQWPPL